MQIIVEAFLQTVNNTFTQLSEVLFSNRPTYGGENRGKNNKEISIQEKRKDKLDFYKWMVMMSLHRMYYCLKPVNSRRV